MLLNWKMGAGPFILYFSVSEVAASALSFHLLTEPQGQYLSGP